MSAASGHPTVAQASHHLWEAFSHHSITMDLAANDPLVRAISEYGDACRANDEARIATASSHVWEELSKHKVTLDLGAGDPVVKALSEYGEACRREGPRT
jgi:hypothetical protein